ncbi:MAG: DUF3306 domain-containing protein [Pseudomonadota bacterium]|nr:DUF3306 domain-containing protein [Pseudomonadota bacterium]
MKPKSTDPGRFSLRRWSQRKLEVARAESQPLAETSKRAAAVITDAEPSPTTPAAALTAPASALPASEALPPIESLTIDSDFAPFFQPQVDEAVKRAALKQLFRDPRFNVMDGLDVYIDDYTQPDPIPAAMLEGLMQRRGFFPPPAAAAAVERDTGEPASDAVAPPATIAAPAVPVAPAEATLSAATAPAASADGASPRSPDTLAGSAADIEADES